GRHHGVGQGGRQRRARDLRRRGDGGAGGDPGAGAAGKTRRAAGGAGLACRSAAGRSLRRADGQFESRRNGLMKICRFDNDRLGVVEGDRVLDVTGALDVLPKVTWPLPQGDPLIAHLPKVVARIKNIKHAATPKPLTAVKLKSPVANPSKIIGAPVNYQLHIAEATKDPKAFANPSANMLNI